MIDIHNHTLFGVDDGPKEIEESVEMLTDAWNQGVTDVILTPHYRKGMFSYPKELIETNYTLLKQAISDKNIPIRIYLGCEYHVGHDIIMHLCNERVLTMNNSQYVLMEFPNEQNENRIIEETSSVLKADYIPIIAHVERIDALVKKPKICAYLQERGALIQCNAAAVIGKEGFWVKRFTAKLLRNQWVDVIARDAHGIKKRVNHMKEAYDYVCHKYGESYGTYLFEESCSNIF